MSAAFAKSPEDCRQGCASTDFFMFPNSCLSLQLISGKHHVPEFFKSISPGIAFDSRSAHLNAGCIMLLIRQLIERLSIALSISFFNP
jgi:hypothetical protein